MRGHRGLGADRHERLESIGQFDRQPSAFGYLALDGVEPLRQGDGRRYRAEPVGIVGIGVEERELHQAGNARRVLSGDASRTQSVRVEEAAFITQLRYSVGMFRLCPICCQISTPQGPERAGT
uniref:Uncharacterized protein n=1 Tax=Streptomyces avermitilis TaxID=33903 RepID=A0A499VX48_STRAX|nr:hypothetical protein SAVMC3_51650 [Streptomyces avermitilis]